MKAKEVGEILGYRDADKVRRIMRGMVHMEGPLRVSESALQAWIAQRTYRPAEETGTGFEPATGRIPRRRGGKLAG